VGLAEPQKFVGYRLTNGEISSLLIKNHGLHIEMQIDRRHPVGQRHPAGVEDVILEAALTTIQDCEVWPENFATRDSLQRHGTHMIPPANAVFKQNLAAVTEREYGDRVGIWRIMDMFARHGLKVTFLMNGLKVEQFAHECREFKSQEHEFSSESYEHEYSFMYTRDEERESIQKTVTAFERVLGQKPTGYLSPGHASTPHTLELVAEAGLVWWADPLNSDNP